MTGENLSATRQLSVELEQAPARPWISDHQGVIRAMVARPRRSIAATVRRHGGEDWPETDDPTAPPLRTPTAPHDLKVIDLPRFEPLDRGGDSMAAMQEWECVVTEIADGVVYAELIDVTAGHRYVEETAEIPLSEFDPDERTQLRRGSVFRWAIGYVRTEAGTRFGASVLRLRRVTRTAPTATSTRPLVFEPD